MYLFLKWENIISVYLQQQIQELEPLRAQMLLLSEQCEKKILDLREQERAEITALKQERRHLQQVIKSMKEQQRSLQTQVRHLGALDQPKTKLPYSFSFLMSFLFAPGISHHFY